MNHRDLPIYKHGSQLLQLATEIQVKMPRAYKRVLGERILTLAVDMLEDMAMANATRGQLRVQAIDQLLVHLRAATAMLRVCHDSRLMSPALWAQSVETLDAIGAQAGGWRRSAHQPVDHPAPAA